VSRPRKTRVRLPLHVHEVKSRGKVYYYYQPYRSTSREGQRVSLPGAPFDIRGMPIGEWWEAYRRLVGEEAPGPRPGTFGALITQFQASPEWNALSAATRSDWSRYLRWIEQAWGTLNVRHLEPKHVLKLRDKYAQSPSAANNLLRCMSSMMSWCVLRGWRDTNPCVHVKKLKGGAGYAPWDAQDIDHFKAHARNDLWHAAALALYSGQRLGDVLKMRWDDFEEGLIAVTQNKTNKKLRIPMHSQLRPVLSAIPRRSVTIITNSRGTPWTVMGFRASWATELNRSHMQMLREKERVFHGLRKSAVVFLLEAGCTDAEVAAVTGQSRKMVEHYSRQVNQQKLAARAILKWETASADNSPGEDG
jgi:integrase